MNADCLFCDIGRHDVLAQLDGWYARYDAFPALPGHIELVPARHVETLFDLSANDWTTVQRLLHIARDVLILHHHPDGWTVGVNDGPAAGQSIPHLHIHLIPRRFGDVPDPRGGIRRGLPNCDPDLWAGAAVSSRRADQ